MLCCIVDFVFLVGPDHRLGLGGFRWQIYTLHNAHEFFLMVFSSQVCLRCFCGRFARVCWSLVLLIFLPKILKMFLFALCIMVICV